ncbi:MAG: 4-hydroxy-tetrahydrodipicolinate reductase [Dehalococcoidia bacterium]
MDQIKVLVHGVLGKMGQEVLRAVCRDQELEAVAGVDIKGETNEIALPNGSGSVPLSSDLESAIGCYHPDVLVDFSTAEATMPAARIAAKQRVRLVIGTTGLSTTDLDEIKKLCQSQGLGAVVAANFSLAAALMIHSAKTAAKFFDYAEIIEMHHEQKADAPSGTALVTAREMVKSRGKAFAHPLTEKESVPNCRGGQFEGIALHSIRLPGLLAHQEVVLGAPGQTLTIRLDQISREAFMPSVLLSIKKVVELKEAVFGLDSILGL